MTLDPAADLYYPRPSVESGAIEKEFQSPDRSNVVRLDRTQSREAVHSCSKDGERSDKLEKKRREFTPTTMAACGRDWERAKTVMEKELAKATNMSSNYMGEPGNLLNYSHEDLPDDQNCSFWLTNLPRNVLEHDVLGQIRQCGRVNAFYINKGMAALIGHAAAKISFITQRGASQFWARNGLQPGTLRVGNRVVCVRRNRVKVPDLNVPHDHSRCVLVEGPPNAIDQQNLEQFFRSKFVFEIDEVIDHTQSPGVASLEFRFSSYRGQAQLAKPALLAERQFRNLPNFRVRFMPDPCA